MEEIQNPVHPSAIHSFEQLQKDLSPNIASLSKVDLTTKNLAQQQFDIQKANYTELLRQPLDPAQKKITKQWMKSAKTEVEQLKPDQVLFRATQKTLQSELASFQVQIQKNQERWESPSLLRKIFYNIEENKQKKLTKLTTQTTDLSARIKNFDSEVTKFQTTASKTATKITSSWTNCERQITLYGKARDTLVATSRLLHSTQSQLNRYSPAAQESLSPKLRQLEALEERLGQLKTARANNQLNLSTDKIFHTKQNEMERLSKMFETLNSEIQTTLATAPKKTLGERISDVARSISSPPSTVAAEKEALLSALKESQIGLGTQPKASGAEKGRQTIFGHGTSSSSKVPSNIIKKTVEKIPQAVFAALEVLIARCEVDPANRASKQELLSLLHAMQMHAIGTNETITKIFKEHPSLRNRIAASKLYDLEQTDKEFLTQKNNEKGEKITLSMKLSHIDNHIWLWQCESELTSLAAGQSTQIAKELATPNLVADAMQVVPPKSKTAFLQVSKELQETEKVFLHGLQQYRNLAADLWKDPTTPEGVKAVCQDVVNKIGPSPNSFIDQSPLLEGTDTLEDTKLCQKILENISGPKMQSQMARIGDLCQNKFTNTNPNIITKYLNDIGRTSDASQVSSWAISGAQRNPRYELLLVEMQKKIGSEENPTNLSKDDFENASKKRTQLRNNIGNLLEIMKCKMSITNRGIV